MGTFVHLHVHTEYSLREGALRIRDSIADAVHYGMPAVAMTDTNAMYGAMAFYRAARKAGIKPILGVQLQVANVSEETALPPGRVLEGAMDTAVFLAENLNGYRTLVRLVTLAHQKQRQPFVTWSELASAAKAMDVIALVGGGESAPIKLFSKGDDAGGKKWLDSWLKVWPESHLFVDVQDHTLSHERAGLPGVLAWARNNNVPFVATNDVHYRTNADADVQRVLAQVEDRAASVLQGNHYEFASGDEMSKRFIHMPEAIANSLVIAERCSVEIPEKQLFQPRYPTSSGEAADVVLRRAAEAGVKQRYGSLTQALADRLNYELDVIIRLGFADYFLVVADFIRYAHKHGISTGPGRGSAAASLVAYALRITDIDPIENKLLFERFLNPERVSWPDIDTDFHDERRSEVIAYVAERYGMTHVAQIGTFGTFAARAAIRDAGRVLQIDAALIDKLAKMIPSGPGVTLKSAAEQSTALDELLKTNAKALRLWETAKAIEGFPRHTSVHAAGVVISPVPLDGLVPVQMGAEGIPVTQYAMEDCEYIGLMKMDFLGLRTVSIIDACVAAIEKRTGVKWDWRKVSTDDKLTYDMLTRGETEGCFQLESSGIRRVLRDVRPTNLEDIIAVISLYRPGPMDNIPTFVAAKRGRAQVQYPHPDLEPILRDTYGVIIYQEQIMQIASRMAGFTLGQADLLRRAVSKKKRDVLDAERSRFVDGCLKQGYEAHLAHEVYDLIVRFADYGYPRSHAAAYAVLTYRTAYLRANHFAEFAAVSLTNVMGNPDKVALYTRDAKRHGISVRPPCAAESSWTYTVEQDGHIRTGLLAIRGVGKSAADAIISARTQAPFTSLVDFLRRVNSRICTRRVVESLLDSGALGAFLPDDTSPTVGRQILDGAYASLDAKASPGLGLALEPETGGRPQALYIRSKTPVDTLWLEAVKQILHTQPGEVPVALVQGAAKTAKLLESNSSVSVTPELIALLEEVVGLGNVRLGYLPKPQSLQVAGTRRPKS